MKKAEDVVSLASYKYTRPSFNCWEWCYRKNKWNKNEEEWVYVDGTQDEEVSLNVLG